MKKKNNEDDDDEYSVTEVKLTDEEIEKWINQLKDIDEHVHLEFKNGEVLVHRKN